MRLVWRHRRGDLTAWSRPCIWSYVGVRRGEGSTPPHANPLRVYLLQGDECKARYAILFQIWTFPSKPEDEAHIGPTATYDEVIYPGFQHDITALQIQGYNISYNRHTTA